jgi:hypothetical protein
LDSETSGRDRGPVLEAYHKIFGKGDEAADRVQMAHLHALGRKGLLDADYIGKMTREYIHTAFKDTEKQVEYILDLNKEGVLDNFYTAKQLNEAIDSDYACRYGEETQQWYVAYDSSKASNEQIRRVWDLAIDWFTANAAETMKTLEGEKQKEFGFIVFDFFRNAPVGSGENSTGFVLPTPAGEEGRLYVIFNAEATKSGEAYITYNSHIVTPTGNWWDYSGSVPEALERMSAETPKLRSHFKNYDRGEREWLKARRNEVRDQLKAYQKAHPSAPKTP